MRRSLGSLDDIDPESSMIASRFVLGVQLAALEAGAALADATPTARHAARAAQVVLQAMRIRTASAAAMRRASARGPESTDVVVPSGPRRDRGAP